MDTTLLALGVFGFAVFWFAAGAACAYLLFRRRLNVALRCCSDLFDSLSQVRATLGDRIADKRNPYAQYGN